MAQTVLGCARHHPLRCSKSNGSPGTAEFSLSLDVPGSSGLRRRSGAHGATNKEHHVCARRRVGEVAGSYPPRLCREGKRKLTESAKEFPKDSAGYPLLGCVHVQWVMSPEGSLWEAR